MSVDTQARFAATFVDELVRNGVTDAVVSPGKRATLVAAAIARHPGLRTHVVVDERSAAFFALGLARRQRRPTLLWCTSGTAVAEYHPAVLEASHACVPLIVATGDRPPEQRAVRDWQSIDQTHIFGRAVRWFFDFGVADDAMAGSWRSTVSRACIEASGDVGAPGPVHVNVPIREPISLLPVEPVAGRDGCEPWHRALRPPSAVEFALPDDLNRRKGLIVLGAGDVSSRVVQQASEHLNWPVLTTVRSTVSGSVANVIGAQHALLRNTQFAASHQPEVVLHVGEPLLSPTMAEWLGASGAVEWSVEQFPSWQGESRRAACVAVAEPEAFLESVVARVPASENRSWLQSWSDADAVAQSAIDEVLENEAQLNEAAIARSLLQSLPSSSNLFVSTSMPVRNVDWWSRPRSGVRVWANRGVSGLDGVTSTAFGVAAASPAESNVLLIGDLGVLHDLNALWAVAKEAQLVVVVVDNNGGGIFRSFPMVDELGDELYERIVETPQSVDIPAVANALGVAVTTVGSPADLTAAVASSIDAGGVRMVYCRTDARYNTAVVNRLHAAVGEALG